MKKSLIVMDPSPLYSTIAPAFNKLQRLRDFLEIDLWILPRIKRLNQNCSINIVSEGSGSVNYLADKTGVSVLNGSISKNSIDYALEQSIKLSQSWYKYGELPKLIQIHDVNIAEVLQESMMTRLFLLFKQMELANNLINSTHPDIIYLQSALFPSCQAFKAVSKANNIKCCYLLPKVYRGCIAQVVSYMRSRIFQMPEFNTYSTSLESDNEPQNRILMDTPSLNYFNAMLPIINELLKLESCDCYIIGKEIDFSDKIKNVRKINIELIDMADHKEKIKGIRTYFQQNLKKDTQFQNIFTYKDMNFWEIIREDLDCFFNKECFEVARDIATFNQVTNRIRPNILAVGTDSAIAMRSHVLVANKNGIPVLEVQHGFYSPTGIRATLLIDKIAAGGEYSKNVFMKYGAREEQIVVTGWPKFDIYKNLRDKAYEKYNIDILFATDPIDVGSNLMIIKSIVSFIGNYPKLRLIVKPHPAEDSKIYRIIRNHNQIVLHESRGNMSKLLASSDVLILRDSSTVGLEAACLDKPIIYINLTNKESIYVSSGIAMEITKLDELARAINNVLYDEGVRAELAEARKHFVYEHAYLQDGLASQRVADLITRMIDESRKSRSEA